MTKSLAPLIIFIRTIYLIAYFRNEEIEFKWLVQSSTASKSSLWWHVSQTWAKTTLAVWVVENDCAWKDGN